MNREIKLLRLINKIERQGEQEEKSKDSNRLLFAPDGGEIKTIHHTILLKTLESGQSTISPIEGEVSSLVVSGEATAVLEGEKEVFTVGEEILGPEDPLTFANDREVALQYLIVLEIDCKVALIESIDLAPGLSQSRRYEGQEASFFITEGKGELTTENGIIKVSQGDLFYIPPDKAITFTSTIETKARGWPYDDEDEEIDDEDFSMIGFIFPKQDI